MNELEQLVERWRQKYKDFHHCTNKRRARNRITSIENVNVDILTEEDEIGEALLDYYSSLFTIEGVVLNGEVLNSIGCVVSDVMNDSLI